MTAPHGNEEEPTGQINRESDDWPTTITEPIIDHRLALGEVRKSIFDPPRHRPLTPYEVRMYVEQNSTMAHEIAYRYKNSGAEELADEARTHYEWALIAATGKPWLSANLHFQEAILRGYQVVRSDYALHHLDKLTLSLNSAILNLNDVKAKGHEWRERKESLGRRIQAAARHYGVGHNEAPRRDLKEVIEGELEKIGANVRALGKFSTDQTVEIADLPPWQPDKTDGWDLTPGMAGF